MSCFLQDYIKFEVKKTTHELCLIALKIDVKFEGKLTLPFLNDIINVANFTLGRSKVSKLGLSLDAFI